MATVDRVDPDVIEIAVTADRGYVPHVAAMVHSAITVDGQPPLTVHLLHGGDVSDAVAPLRNLIDSSRGRLDVHEVDSDRIAGLSAGRFSVTAWYRVLLPEILPDTDRVIHLDGDILVRGGLKDLWERELGGALFGAVQNPLYPWMEPAWTRLGLAPGTPYLNSGVLLMDLAALRARGSVDELIGYGVAHPANPWPEQDALSVVHAHEWADLHPRWNLQSTVTELRAAHLPWSVADVRDARRDPAIRHFSGPMKPWDGWASRRDVSDYLAHRRGAGYPTAERIRPRLLARLLPHLPLRLRRQVMLRILRRGPR